jgi:methionine-rich copper-binding protein CopC
MGGALLDHAEPGVVLTVTGHVRDLRLYFNQSVLAAASSVQVTNSAGVAMPTTRPVGDPSDQHIVIVRFGRVLPPGSYRVSWHVVSIDQVPASGAWPLRSRSCPAQRGYPLTANEIGIDRSGSCGERVRRLVPWAGKTVGTRMDLAIDMETIGTSCRGVARMRRPEPAIVGPRIAKFLRQRRPIGNGQFRLDSSGSDTAKWPGGTHGFLKIERVDL